MVTLLKLEVSEYLFWYASLFPLEGSGSWELSDRILIDLCMNWLVSDIELSESFFFIE
jgi:hypothetical protein